MVARVQKQCGPEPASLSAEKCEKPDAAGEGRGVSEILKQLLELVQAALGQVSEKDTPDASAAPPKDEATCPPADTAGAPDQDEANAPPVASAPPAGGAGAPPGAGAVSSLPPGIGGGWAPQTYEHRIHTPYNEPQAAHFSSDGNTMHFNLQSGNAPFKPGSGTDPRSEYRVRNDYGSGEHLFSADYQVHGTPGNESTIFQIHRGEDPGGATNMMLRVKDGQLKNYGGEPLANVGDQPFNLKVYHNANNGNIKVFVNDQPVLDTQEKNPSTGNYWKFGLYGVEGAAESTVSNVQMFSRG